MAHGLKISEGLSSQELRIEGRRAETARMYAIANAPEGRAEAARLAGMYRQALRGGAPRNPPNNGSGGLKVA
jgi:hypothetical protein